MHSGKDLKCFGFWICFNGIALSAALSRVLVIKSLGLLTSFSIPDGAVCGKYLRNKFQFALL
jgi:hypothetical protein